MDDLESGREYHFSDPELSLFAATLAVFVQRDITELEEHGITAQDLSELISRQKAFALFPSDDDSIGTIMVAGKQRDEYRRLLQIAIQSSLRFIAKRFGKDSPHLRRIAATTGLALMSDADFEATANRTLTVCTEVQEALAEKGYTTAHLRLLQRRIDEFAAAVQEYSLRQSNREGGTRARIALGNALYELCSMICDAGKACYLSSDYAKYADYIIYKDTSPSTAPGIVQNLRYEAGEVQWGELAEATSYQLVRRLDTEEEFSLVYAGSETHQAFPLPQPPQPGVLAYIFKIRARNAAGVGEFSTELRVEAHSS